MKTVEITQEKNRPSIAISKDCAASLRSALDRQYRAQELVQKIEQEIRGYEKQREDAQAELDTAINELNAEIYTMNRQGETHFEEQIAA